MADARYIIDIILNARDNTSDAVRKATEQLGLLREEQQRVAEANQRTERSFEEMSSRVRTSAARLKEEYKALGDSTGSTVDQQVRLEQAAKAYIRVLNDASASETRRTQGLQQLQKAQADLALAITRTKDAEAEQADAASKASAKRLQESATELERIRARRQYEAEAIREQTRLDQEAARARADQMRQGEQMAKEVEQNEQARHRSRMERANQAAQAEKDLARVREQLLKQEQQQADEAERKRIANYEARKRQETEAQSRFLSDAGKRLQAIQNERRDNEQAARAREAQMQRELRLQREYVESVQRVARIERERQQAARRGEDVAAVKLQLDAGEARAQAAALATELKALFGRIEANVDVDSAEAQAHIAALLAQKQLLGRDVNIDVDVDAASAIAQLKAVEDNTRKTNQELGLLRGLQRSVTEGFHQSSGTISSFDNFLRGLLSLGIAAFFNQLVLLAGAAAGAMFSLASSAAMAGAAVGGALVAGIGQALGPLGLLVAAAGRVAAVMDAVQQANLLQQQQSYQGAQQAAQQANAVDAVRSAEERLADAGRRVRESQVEVNNARQEGIDKLNELILAERGLSLGVEESEAAIRKAVQSGQTAALPRALLRRDESRAALAETRGEISERRTAGPEASPEIQQAQEGLRDARRAAEEARSGLDRARRSAAQADAGITAAAGKLNYLLGQLSGAERRLYEAVIQLQDVWRDFSQEVTAPILDAFTGAIEKVIVLLQRPDIIAAATSLSQTIGRQFTRMFDFLTSNEVIDQFLRIAEAGRQNLKPLTDIAINIGKAFLDIAETAGPAFREIIEWVREISDDVVKFFESGRKSGELQDFFKEGVTHLKAWGDLVWEIIQLFVALAGPGGGAREGLGLVRDMAEAIGGWADEIEKPGTKLNEFFNRFFSLSREMLEAMGPVLGAIAEEFDKTFTKDGLSAVEGFAFFLSEILIPAVGDFARFLGSATVFLADFGREHPNITKVASSIVAASLAFSVFGRVFTIFGPITSAIGFLVTRLSGMLQIGTRLTPVFARFAPVLARIGTLATGPFGLLAGVLALLLQRAGKLDDIWRKILDTGQELWRELKPGFDDLWESVSDLVDSLGEGGGLLDVLTAIASLVGDVLLEAINSFGILLQNIGRGVIRVFGGVLDFVNALISLFKGDFDEAGRLALRGIRKIATGIKDVLWGVLSGIGGFFVRLFRRAIEALWDFITPPSKFIELGKAIVEGFWDGIVGLGRLLVRGVRGAIDAVSDFIHNLGPTLEDFGARIVKAIAKGIRNAPREIIEALKDQFTPDASAKGVLDKAAKLGNPLLFLGGQEGGPIPGGYGGGDRVSLMAEPGEHLLTKEEVRAAGGHGAIYALRRALGGGGQSHGGRFQQGGRVGAGGAGIGVTFSGNLNEFVEVWGNVWETAAAAARRGARAIQNAMQSLRVSTNRTLDLVARSFRRAFAEIEESAENRTNRLMRVFSRSFANIQDTVYDGFRYITRASNQALQAFDADPVRISLSAPNARRRAGGGVVGNLGERGEDAVPTWLGRGEAVLNWAHQKVVNSALWNTYGTTLPSLFKQTSAYHAGGPGAIGHARGRMPDVDGALPGFAPFMQYFRSKFGNNLYVMSGYRPGSTTTSGNVSNHAFRRATDISTPTIAGSTEASPPPRTNVDALHSFISRYIPAPPRLDFLWRTMTGGNHFNHIHLGMSEMVVQTIKSARQWIAKNLPEGDVFGGGMAVKLRKVLGKDGPMKSVVEKIIERVTKAANKFVDRQMDESLDMGDGPGPPSIELGPGGSGEQVFDYFVKRGLTDYQAAAFVGNFLQESGLSTTVVNASSGATGLAQWLGERLTGLHAFARERGGSPYSLQTQLDYVWHELQGPESAAFSAIKGSRSLADAVNAIAFQYERMGAHEAAMDTRMSGAQNALDQYSGSSDHGPRKAQGGFVGEYARGGELPGRDGQPVPILAHAGEWVLNRMQQSKLAEMMGMSAGALKGLLGFGGSRKARFQDGGEVRFAAAQAQSAAIAAAAEAIARAIERRVGRADPLRGIEPERRQAAARGRYEFPTLPPQSLEGIGREVQLVFNAIRNISKEGKIGKQISQFIKNIRTLTDSDGYLDRMSEELEEMSDRLSTSLELAQVGFKRVGAKLLRRAGGPLVDAVKIADRTIDQYEDIGRQLGNDRRVVQQALRKTMNRIRQLQQGGVTKKEEDSLKELEASRVRFMEELGDMDQKFAENRASLFEARIARFEAVTEREMRKAESKAGQAEFLGRIADILGQDKVALSFGESQVNALREQQAVLGERLQRAMAMAKRNPKWREHADSLLQQYNDVSLQVAQGIRDNLEAGINIINSDIERRQGDRSMWQRIGEAFGIDSWAAPLLQDQINLMQEQHARLHDQLRNPALWESGNMGLVNQIVGQMQDLQAQIAEATAQMMNLAIEQLDESLSRAQQGQAFRERLIDVRERGGDRLGAAAARQQLSADRISQLQTSRHQFESLRAQAFLTGNQGAWQELTDRITEMNVAIEEENQTRRELVFAYRQTAADIISGRTERSTGLIDAASGIIRRVGEMFGNVDIGKIASLLEQAGNQLRIAAGEIVQNVQSAIGEFGGGGGNILQQLVGAFQAGPESFATTLARLGPQIAALESTMGDVERSAFQALIQSMLDNTLAVIENTDQLNQINTPGGQSFSSTLWQMFRTAVFTGSGTLLPQYQYAVPQMHNGGYVTKGGIFDLEVGERVVDGKQNVEQHEHIYITNPTEVADPDYIFEVAEFKRSQRRAT